jgi:hypothetical protein
MITISGTADWSAAHPGALIGLMELAGVDNTQSSPQLNQRKRETEARLRKACAGYRLFFSFALRSAFIRLSCTRNLTILEIKSKGIG